MSNTINLWCQGGSHFWDRDAKRGRKPLSCPEHLNAKPAVRAPGLKTRETPKVQDPVPQATVGNVPEPSVDALAKAREAKTAKANTKQDGASVLAAKALASDKTPDELKRKISYVENQLKVRTQDGFLLKLRKDLIREAKVA